MTPLFVNSTLSSLDKSCRSRLSFVAFAKSRRMYGVTSRQLAEKVVSDGRLSYGESEEAQVFQGRSAFGGPAATQFIGAFEFHYGQAFEADRVPLATVTPFEALGEKAYVFGSREGPHLVVDAINVTLPASNSEYLIDGFLELRPIHNSVPLPIDGALVVDGRGRGVGMLVGRSSDRYFAVGIEDCLKALDLEPIGGVQLLEMTSQPLPENIDLEMDKSTRIGLRSQPAGQLADIIKEHVEASYAG